MKSYRRLLGLILAVIMCVGLIPVPALADSGSAAVTFQVVGGTWADGTAGPITVSVPLTEGRRTLDGGAVPSGMIPGPGYGQGRWASAPDLTPGGITGDAVYCWLFTELPSQKTPAGNGSSVPEPTKGEPDPTVPEPTKGEPDPTVPEPTRSDPDPTVPEPTKGEPDPTVPEPTKGEPGPTVPEPTKPVPVPTGPKPGGPAPVRPGMRRTLVSGLMLSLDGVNSQKTTLGQDKSLKPTGTFVTVEVKFKNVLGQPMAPPADRDGITVLLKRGRIHTPLEITSAKNWVGSEYFPAGPGGLNPAVTLSTVPELPNFGKTVTKADTGYNWTIVYQTKKPEVSEETEKSITAKLLWQDEDGDDIPAPVDQVWADIQQGSENYQRVDLTKSSDWMKMLTVPKKDSEGQDATYRLGDVQDVTGFEFHYSDEAPLTVVARKKPVQQKVKLSIRAVWLDPSGTLREAPAEVQSVSVRLIRSGTELAAVTLAPDSWEDQRDAELQDGKGNAYSYAYQDPTKVSGFAETLTGSAESGWLLTYREESTGPEPEFDESTQKKIKVEVQWQDSDNSPMEAPVDSIWLSLEQEGTPYRQVTMTKAKSWKTQEIVDRFDGEGGSDYRIGDVQPVPGFEPDWDTGNPLTVILRRDPSYQMKKLKVRVVWLDEKNVHIGAPAGTESVTLGLTRNGEPVETLSISKPSWEKEKQVPLSDTYAVETPQNVDGFTPEITGSEAGGWTLTYRKQTPPEPVDRKITFKVLWQNADGDSMAGPVDPGTTELTVKLDQNYKPFRQVKILAASDWKLEEVLPVKTEDGEEAVYRIQGVVEPPEGYWLIYHDNDTLIMKQKEAAGKVVFPVYARFTDAAGKLKAPSGNPVIQVQLQENGNDYKVLTLNRANGWRVEVEEPALVETRDAHYTAAVKTKPADCSAEVSGDQNQGFQVEIKENRLLLTVEKLWQDAQGRPMDPPPGITEVKFLMKISNQSIGERSEELSLKKSQGWTYKAWAAVTLQGRPVVYSVTELTEIPGFASSATGSLEDGFQIVNKLEDRSEYVELQVRKKWLNEEGEPFTPPIDRVQAQILQNGKELDLLELHAGQGWRNTLQVPQKDRGGKAYSYTVEEVYAENQAEDMEDYESSVSGSLEDGFVITNRRKSQKISIELEKVWRNADGTTAVPPVQSVQVQLQRDGADYGDPLELKASEGWKATVDQLPRVNQSGREYAYGVKELTQVTGFGPRVETMEGGFQIINTKPETPNPEPGGGNKPNPKPDPDPEPEKVTITLEKLWLDRDGRPMDAPAGIDYVLVDLYQDGVFDQTVAIQKAKGWKATAQIQLETTAGGTSHYYKRTAKEREIPGFTSTVGGDMQEKVLITNRVEPLKTRTLTVTKVWQNTLGQNALAPSNINKLDVDIYRNGSLYETLEVNRKYGWTNSITVPTADDRGNVYRYTAAERAVPSGYTASVAELSAGYFQITNRETVTTTIVHVWHNNVIPKTGDERGILLWMTLNLLSAAGILCLGTALVIRKRKNRKA